MRRSKTPSRSATA